MGGLNGAWEGWGDLLGCRCFDCEEHALRFAGLWLDAQFNIIGSVAVSEDRTLTREIAVGDKTLSAIVGVEAHAALEPHLRAALGGGAWSGSFERRGQHGVSSLAKIACFPVFFGAKILGVQITIEDRSQAYAQKAAHRALKDRLAIIQDNAADAIISINERGVIESANRAATTMFGWSAAELIGSPITRLMPPPQSARHMDYIDRYLQTGESGILNREPREVWAQRHDGSRVRIEISVAEAMVGERTVFIGVCRERTVAVRRASSVMDLDNSTGQQNPARR